MILASFSCLFRCTLRHTNCQLPSPENENGKIRLPVDGLNHPHPDTGEGEHTRFD